MTIQRVLGRLPPHFDLAPEPQFDSTLTCPRVPNYNYYSGRVIRYDSQGRNSRFVEVWSPNSSSIPFLAGQPRALVRIRETDGLPDPRLRRRDGSLGRFDHTLFAQFYSSSHPWWPFIAPPPSELHNCAMDWRSFEMFWNTSNSSDSSDHGRIHEGYVKLLRRRSDELVQRLNEATSKYRVCPSDLIPPDPIDTTVLGLLEGELSFYVALDVVSRLQRQLRENRAYEHYLLLSNQHPRYSLSSMPEESETAAPLPRANAGYIGVFANHMDVWDLAWYTRKARVSVFFANELEQDQFRLVERRSQIVNPFALTYAERSQRYDTSPYANLHYRYGSQPASPYRPSEIIPLLGLAPPFATPPARMSASSSIQGWKGALCVANSDLMATRVDSQARLLLQWRYDEYLERARREHPCAPLARPQASIPSVWATKSMGPWDGWAAAQNEQQEETNWVDVENLLSQYKPQQRPPANSVERCQFQALDRIFLGGDEARIPWVRPPAVSYKRGKTAHWDHFILTPIEECPDEMNDLRGRYDYAFRAIGKRNDDLNDTGARWYDRERGRILHFPCRGHLQFPLGYTSEVALFGAPAPKYPFFSYFNEKFSYRTASYWMYTDASATGQGRTDPPPQVDSMVQISEVGLSAITGQTRWIGEDTEEEDSLSLSLTATPNVEDNDPVPVYQSQQEPVPPYIGDAMNVDKPVTTTADGDETHEDRPSYSQSSTINGTPALLRRDEVNPSHAPLPPVPTVPTLQPANVTAAANVTIPQPPVTNSTPALRREEANPIHVSPSPVLTTSQLTNVSNTPTTAANVTIPPAVATNLAESTGMSVGQRRRRRRLIHETQKILGMMGHNLTGTYDTKFWESTDSQPLRQVQQTMIDAAMVASPSNPQVPSTSQPRPLIDRLQSRSSRPFSRSLNRLQMHPPSTISAPIFQRVRSCISTPRTTNPWPLQERLSGLATRDNEQEEGQISEDNRN